jgi:hypothetical protein
MENDGKSWLCKVARKSKTIFWLSVQEKAFRTTFYFTERASDLIAGSTIPQAMKDQFAHEKKIGKLHGLTVVFTGRKDIVCTRALIVVKLKVK